MKSPKIKSTVSICVIVMFVLVSLSMLGCKDQAGTERHDHSGHGHEDHEEGHDEKGHEGHDHDVHSDHEEDDHGAAHDEHEDAEDVVLLTREQLEEAGVVLAPLSSGTIATYLTLPGEIGFNADQVVHVTPRVPGIVAEVHSHIGSRVTEGQLLTVIDSPQLGETKIEYLTALQSLAQAHADLEREQTISKNTKTLLALLLTRPGLATLQEKAPGLRIGEHKGRLISSYAKLHLARTNFQREQKLRKEGLSTQSELLAAEEAINSNQAEYLAAFEDIDFRYRAKLTQAERAFQVAESTTSNARRRLHLLGLSEDQIRSIDSEPDLTIARYELRSPISGRIILKHASIGEKISSDKPVFVVANLETVWLNISVYAQYLSDIREGQPVTVMAGDRKAPGRIIYVSSNLSEATRTVVARVVLDNADRRWRPGEFVTIRIETGQRQVERAVPLESLQRFEGREVVFAQAAHGIIPRPVRLGQRNDRLAELLEGPPLGTAIVVNNSFLMKSELGKSAAGHQH